MALNRADAARPAPGVTGCYEAPRAAALAGVPAGMLQTWARRRVVVPSVARERERMWSWVDLVCMRLAWLRERAGHSGGTELAVEVGGALDQLELNGNARLLERWDRAGRPRQLLADRKGALVVGGDASDGLVDLMGPFALAGEAGPDLVRPRPHLRIVPGKVAGEPHIDGSRLTTRTVAALAARGLDAAHIAGLFPDQNKTAIAEAIELEAALARGGGG
jgi:uncharacterized protein (DUF433 family)